MNEMIRFIKTIFCEHNAIEYEYRVNSDSDSMAHYDINKLCKKCGRNNLPLNNFDFQVAKNYFENMLHGSNLENDYILNKR